MPWTCQTVWQSPHVSKHQCVTHYVKCHRDTASNFSVSIVIRSKQKWKTASCCCCSESFPFFLVHHRRQIPRTETVMTIKVSLTSVFVLIGCISSNHAQSTTPAPTLGIISGASIEGTLVRYCYWNTCTKRRFSVFVLKHNVSLHTIELVHQ